MGKDNLGTLHSTGETKRGGIDSIEVEKFLARERRREKKERKRQS